MAKLRLREVRQRQGFTQAELAERMKPKTNQETISKIELWKRDATFTWLNRAAKALGVPVADLIEEDAPARGGREK